VVCAEVRRLCSGRSAPGCLAAWWLGCQASVRAVRAHGAVGPRPARAQSV